MMLNENELRQVITAAAQKNTDRNLVVLLRTDTFAVNANMMTGTNIGCISAIDRRNMASNLSQEDTVKLQVRLETSIGCCSDGMKDLLASVMSKVKHHNTILIEFVDNRLNMSEMVIVTDFLKEQFPLISFIFTTISDMVVYRSKNANVMYVFDDEWYLYQSSEISPDCMKAPKQDYRNLSALFNHALNDLWFDKDRRRFEEIDANNMLPSDRLIYDNIKCYLSPFPTHNSEKESI